MHTASDSGTPTSWRARILQLWCVHSCDRPSINSSWAELLLLASWMDSERAERSKSSSHPSATNFPPWLLTPSAFWERLLRTWWLWRSAEAHFHSWHALTPTHTHRHCNVSQLLQSSCWWGSHTCRLCSGTTEEEAEEEKREEERVYLRKSPEESSDWASALFYIKAWKVCFNCSVI